MQRLLNILKPRLSGNSAEDAGKAARLRLASRHPFAVPFITFAVLLTVAGAVYVAARQTDRLPKPTDANIVIINHDKQERIVPSKRSTVGTLLGKLQIKLHEGDTVEPDINTVIDRDQFRINVYRAKPVQVIDGERTIFAYSAAKTPRSVAAQAGAQLFAEDRVITTPVQDFLRTGGISEQVYIDRARAINVDLYGTPLVLRTHAKTVRQLIKEKNIRLIKNDRVEPGLDTPISLAQKVSLIRTGTKVETVTEKIEMPVQSIADASLSYGTSAVRQQGATGEQVVTYQITLVNNVETGRSVIQKVINKEPVKHIVVVGSSLSGIKGDMARAGIAPSDYSYVDYIVSHESGWCPTKAQGQYGRCPPYAGSVPAGGGYGLCQSTPGSKMATAGADWATNPVTQLRWCSDYAKRRYGGWAGAYNFWLSNRYW